MGTRLYRGGYHCNVAFRTWAIERHELGGASAGEARLTNYCEVRAPIPPLWKTKHGAALPGYLFELRFRLGDLGFSLLESHGRENGVMNGVRTNLERL